MGTDKTYSISVVIPNYNGKHLLEDNLPSVVAALKHIQCGYEIIVVDDASVDESVAFMKQKYPDITLLVNELNKGFSPTINRGIFEAKYDLVLALNSDVKLTPDYFEEQLKYFGEHDTFGVMGKIIDHAGTQLQDGAKYPKTSIKGIKATFNYIPDVLPVSVWLPSFFLSGANALMDRKKLIQLGGFDELFAPFYFEDADLGLRAWRVGWRCYFEPNAVCMHATSSTISRLKSEKVKTIIERNRIFFNYLHLDGSKLFLYKLWIRIRAFGRLISGNTTSFRALQLVNNNEAAVKASRNTLRMLQKKNQKTLTVGEVESVILKQIEALPYRVF